MRRIWIVVLLMCLLCGCGAGKISVEPGIQLRRTLAGSKGCSFDTTITADYGEKTYTFDMHCEADPSGNLRFTATKPDTIAGIQGQITDTEGSLIFDDNYLAFELLADGQITPVSGPWLFIKALLSGYIRGCESKEREIHLIIDDSYEENAMQVDVYLTKDLVPVQADILWRGKRIVTLQVENFQIL